LYEALSGRPPYAAESFYEVVKLVCEAKPPPLELPAGCPPELQALVMKLMAREPKNRPTTAAAVARALDDLLAGRVRSARGLAAWIRANPGSFLVLCASVPVPV